MDAATSDNLIRVSPGRGLFTTPVRAELSTSMSDTTLFYTTDGSIPSTDHGTRYSTNVVVTTTTTLRIAAFKYGKSVASTTHSYIFPNDVIHQTGKGFPDHWGVTNGHPVAAYYRMHSPTNTVAILKGLSDIPTLSVSATLPDLFDEKTGIYSNPMQNGEAWERPASLELIFPSGKGEFQIDCGVRIQGGWNRRPEECPKHSLRLLFKKKYGAKHLDFPLFGTNGVTRFETLILRGGCNNTWLHWSGEERLRGDYLRDEWMRHTSAEMGLHAARGFFVHLYLNGLYWGLYDLTERPSAPFIAALEGGQPEDYDSRNGDHVLSGDTVAWDSMFVLANAGVKSADAYQKMQGLLDVDRFIAYMLLNFYGANADWDRASNWYAARRRNPAGKFQFFVWDGERTIEKIEDNTMAADEDQSPLRLFHKLSENDAFRARFRELVRVHCYGEGALTQKKSIERFSNLVHGIENAIYAESARWGSYRAEFHQYKTGPYLQYTPELHWKPEIKRILENYFPNRLDRFILQLREKNLAD